MKHIHECPYLKAFTSFLCCARNSQGDVSRYSRRQLYQGILRRLLRWRFARHKLKASKEYADLEKKFSSDSVLLGGVAWKCKLNDCQLLAKMN